MNGGDQIMTELSFLIDLLMNHKLPKLTKQAIAERIKEVESNIGAPNVRSQAPRQAPSTIAALSRQADEANPAIPAPEPVAQIAQTPAAAAALAARKQSIAQALSGKMEKGQTSPRKW